MCGLAGIFAYVDGAPPVEQEELLRIRERMRNRGPDGEGAWISQDRRVGLAHRRLAIIDLSSGGAQPMASIDGRYQIVFNGEIYNYRELRKELEASGAAFRSQSDTEVLLELFARQGPSACSRLRGMFAFAIWDARDQALFLARDPFGIKPLYLHDDGRTIRFASQVKALLAGGAIARDIEAAGQIGYWIWGHVPEPWTLYRDVNSLKPGTWLSLSRGGRRGNGEFESIERLVNGTVAVPELRREREPSLQVVLRKTLLDSVRHHLIADVPVGVFLSSGVDSMTIAALATECGGSLRTITLGFEEFRGGPEDETALAAEVASRYGARHETIWLKKADLEGDLDRFFDDMDQPSTDGANAWLISRVAARAGLKVALSGLGGDEFFCGYPSFRQVPRIRQLAAPFGAIPRLGKAFRRISRPIVRRLVSEKFLGLLEYGSTWKGAYLLRRATRMPWELESVSSLNPEQVRDGLDRLANSLHGDGYSGGTSPWAAVASLEASVYLRGQLLRDADWAGMAHSLEIRVPFVDVEVARLAGEAAARGEPLGKRDEAGVARPPLPDAVLRRPKSRFLVPTREWFRPKRPRGQRRGLLGWQQLVHDRFIAPRGKKILLLTTDAYGGHGGIALYNRDLAEALAAMPNVSEVVVVPRTIRFEPEQLPEKVRFFANAAGSKWKFVKCALSLCRKDFDIVICGHINLLRLAAPISRLLKAPLVLLTYGIDVWKEPDAITRRLLPNLSAVWCISAITRDKMNAWAHLPEERFALLPNAIHLERYGEGEPRKDLQDKYGLAGAKVIITVARLPGAERYKGVDEVLESMPELLKAEPRLKYMIVGDGDDRARLESKAQDLGLGGAVVFTGLIPESEKADHYRLADVFVMPGRGEGFGFVFLEALASGVPVVGSTLDGSREALRDGELGELVDPTDRVSIYSGIMRSLRKGKQIPTGLQYFAWPAFTQRVSRAVEML